MAKICDHEQCKPLCQYVDGVLQLFPEGKQREYWQKFRDSADEFIKADTELTNQQKELVKGVAKMVRPQPKECYHNSQLMVLFEPELKYYEGMIITRIGIPIEHAWNTLEGKVVDVTLQDATCYIGVEVPRDFFREKILKEKETYPRLARYLLEEKGNPGAIRTCPLCGGKLESYPGASLKVVAREHYVIVHSRRTSTEEERTWASFYNSLPEQRQ